MNKIEIVKTCVEGNFIRYAVREDSGLGLLQQETVNLFIQYHFNESFDCDLSNLPLSILVLPISIYMIPITYFYPVEVVIPEMDKELYEHLPKIYAAYAKIYGPFKEDWRGKVTIKKIVDNKFSGMPKYDKVVFFSGGVDACHAGINNPGKKSLLVSIPDIEYNAKSEGALRDEKFSLIRHFANVVHSDWLLISNNFNTGLFRDQEILKYLSGVRRLSSPAYRFDGWHGIKYVPNMCCVAPISWLMGVQSLVMGSTCEEIEGRYADNFDGANPAITNSFVFANICFAEQDGLKVRRSRKVSNIIEWCKTSGVRTKLWACFNDKSVQCGFCSKCVRTQLNILCAGENPTDWGFDNFSEKQFSSYIRAYKYRESNPCWLWDNIDSIDDNKVYPHLNKMLHWLKRIGYKKYIRRANAHASSLFSRPLRRMLSIKKYPYYAKIILTRLTGL